MAKQTKEVEIEVKERDLGVLTELDPATLDDGFSYRWVLKTPLKVARARAKGYTMVEPSEEKVLNAVGESPEAEDGTYTLGDVVLMKISKLNHKSRRHAVKRRADQRLRGPAKKFKRDAQSKGSERGLDIEVITDKEPQE